MTLRLQPLFPIVAAFALALPFSACERQTTTVSVPATPLPEPVAKTKTLETSLLGSAIDLYDREPSAETAAAVKKAQAKLDGEIAELEERVARKGDPEAEAKMRNLKSYRDAQALRFTALRARASLTGENSAPAVDTRTGADKVRDGAEKAADKVENGARKAGDAIRDAVR